MSAVVVLRRLLWAAPDKRCQMEADCVRSLSRLPILPQDEPVALGRLSGERAYGTHSRSPNASAGRGTPSLLLRGRHMAPERLGGILAHPLSANVRADSRLDPASRDLGELRASHRSPQGPVVKGGVIGQ